MYLEKIKDHFCRTLVRAFVGVIAGIVGGLLTSVLIGLIIRVANLDMYTAQYVSPSMMAVGAMFGGVLAFIYGIARKES